MRNLDIVAMCGSLRVRSTNRTLLEAARVLAPDSIGITPAVDGSIVPYFNADLEGTAQQPSQATEWREQVGEADGLIISTPEYAAGIPGAFKNLLDWLVGEPRFYRKPVAIFTATDRSLGAQASLRLVLSTMSASIIDAACISVPLLGKQMTPQEVSADEHHKHKILVALAAFEDGIRSQGREL
jgi:chromate reductase